MLREWYELYGQEGGIPPPEICDRARVARDRRFDGRFFTGVITTRIYCRPVCPVRPAHSQNVRFFPTAAAAEMAGFRPCFRCRPETAPGSPAWQGSGATVSRALALINQGFLDEHRLPDLALALGVGVRHLTRLFRRYCGVSPGVLARSRRVQMAKRLLDETDLSMTRVAFASGFSSIRRFNSAVRETYARPPLQLRQRLLPRKDAGLISLRLYFRPPYDWLRMLRFLSLTAIPGVECVSRIQYSRTMSVNGSLGWLTIRPVSDETALDLSLSLTDYGQLSPVVARVQRMFDLGADPSQIARVLTICRRQRMAEHALHGIRLPGVWDGFEAAIRAVAEQRVGAARATVLMNDLVENVGTPVSFSAQPGLRRLFPSPEQVCVAPLRRYGASRRVESEVQHLARRVAEGKISFDAGVSFAELVTSLTEEGGLDRAAAAWVGMRTLGEPDADFAGRLRLGARQRSWWQATVTQRALRPWRSYAALLLSNLATPSRMSASLRSDPKSPGYL